MCFAANDWVRCYNFADKKQLPLVRKALFKDFNKAQVDEEMDRALFDLKREGLLKGRKACWVGYDFVGKPRGAGTLATLTIVSEIGSLNGGGSRYYENSCVVFIRHKDGAVFAKPDDLF